MAPMTDSQNREVTPSPTELPIGRPTAEAVRYLKSIDDHRIAQGFSPAPQAAQA
jgi:hypothetical protein